jgi:hypothetical protein
LLLQGFDQAGCQQWPKGSVHAAKRVVSKSATGISHIKIEVRDLELPVKRQRQNTMRVDQAKAMSGAGIMQGQVQQKGRFAGAGLPDGIEVVHPVSQANAKRPVAILVPRDAKRGDWGLHAAILTKRSIET